jgi:hypothetical protein
MVFGFATTLAKRAYLKLKILHFPCVYMENIILLEGQEDSLTCEAHI